MLNQQREVMKMRVCVLQAGMRVVLLAGGPWPPTSVGETAIVDEISARNGKVCFLVEEGEYSQWLSFDSIYEDISEKVAFPDGIKVYVNKQQGEAALKYTFRTKHVDMKRVAEDLSPYRPVLHVSVTRGKTGGDDHIEYVLIHKSILEKAEKVGVDVDEHMYTTEVEVQNGSAFIDAKEYRAYWKKWVADVINAPWPEGFKELSVTVME
jgi:hypothetical protein